MMFLHSEKVLKMRSIGQNRSRYDLFRVLTSSYQSVNMPVFSAIFNRFWQRSERNRPVGFRMTPIPEPEAINIRVADYLTELPPREVLEQKLEAAVAIARERLAARGIGE